MKVNHICTQNCFTVSYACSVFLSNLWILVSSKLLDNFFYRKPLFATSPRGAVFKSFFVPSIFFNTYALFLFFLSFFSFS